MAEKDSQSVWAADGGALERLQHCAVCGVTGNSPALGQSQGFCMSFCGQQGGGCLQLQG